MVPPASRSRNTRVSSQPASPTFGAGTTTPIVAWALARREMMCTPGSVIGLTSPLGIGTSAPLIHLPKFFLASF